MKTYKGFLTAFLYVALIGSVLPLSSCALVDVPDSRNVKIPSPTTASERRTALNERPDSVMYVPLGEDVLVPEISESDVFPSEMVGPYELRGETLAGALQLILADYDISLAFETQAGLTRRITVANLRGDLGKVVNQVCSLANLYCSYEGGTIVVKDTQTFTVTLPPIGTGDNASEFLGDVAEGLSAILGTDAVTQPIVDPTTRTIVYAATQRTADVASRYFQRLRANTAMIVFETYIWEVSLSSGNSTGIDWFKLASFGKFNTGINVNGTIGADFTNPISIGLPTTSDNFNGTTGDIIQFLSQFGAVKTISQPQVTVLSGSQAELRVADTRNYVSQVATTLSEGQSTTSVNTDSVDTGFTLTIQSSWDKSTVYANIDIELTDVKQIDNFAFSDSGTDGGSTTIQLPQTSERQLSTQIRVRPGDSILIAGLVRENDNFDEKGVGFMQPLLPDTRTAQTENLELVILLRPRVVVYTAANDKRYVDFAAKKHMVAGPGPVVPVSEGNTSLPVVDPVQEEIPAGVPAALSASPTTSTVLDTTTVKTAPVIPVTKSVAPVSAPVTIAPDYVTPRPVTSPAPVQSAPLPPASVPVIPATPSMQKSSTSVSPVTGLARSPVKNTPPPSVVTAPGGVTRKSGFTSAPYYAPPAPKAAPVYPSPAAKPTSDTPVIAPYDKSIYTD